MKKIEAGFIVKFTLSLFFIGVLIGVLFFLTFKPDLGASLESFKGLITTTHQNTFVSSMVSISGIFVLSISIIGIPLIAFYIFYEGLSIGFTMGLFLFNYKIKGLFFYLLYLLSSKLIFVALMLLFSILSLRYALKFIESLVSKNKEEIHRSIIYHFYRFLICFALIFVNSIMVYFISNKLVSLFINLIN